METEEERGVAHMIEHLAFRASRTCPQEFDLVKEVGVRCVRRKGSDLCFCFRVRVVRFALMCFAVLGCACLFLVVFAVPYVTFGCR